MNEKIKYPPLFGNCVGCAGCNRLENPEFKGTYRCPWKVLFNNQGENINKKEE